MARITGKDLHITFGSTVLSTDFQSFEVSDEMSLAEVTAGDDAVAIYAATYSSGKANFQGLWDASAGATSGTAVWAAVNNGTEGTLVWSPRGTTTTYPKYTATAIVGSRSQTFPFDGGVEISAEFQLTSVITPSVW